MSILKKIFEYIGLFLLLVLAIALGTLIAYVTSMLLLKLVTSKLPLAESKAIPLGVLSTCIVPITLLFRPDITETMLSHELVTSKFYYYHYCEHLSSHLTL